MFQLFQQHVTSAWVVLDHRHHRVFRQSYGVRMKESGKTKLRRFGSLHPGRLTWNIIIGVWKIIFLSKWVIDMFHLHLPRCLFNSHRVGRHIISCFFWKNRCLLSILDFKGLAGVFIYLLIIFVCWSMSCVPSRELTGIPFLNARFESMIFPTSRERWDTYPFPGRYPFDETGVTSRCLSTTVEASIMTVLAVEICDGEIKKNCI